MLTVRIQMGLMIDPPQKCADVSANVHCMLTKKGNSPGKAFTPPMIAGAFSANDDDAITAKNTSDEITKFLIFSS